MIIKHTFTGSLAETEAAAKMSLMRAVTYNGKRAARLPDLALEMSWCRSSRRGKRSPNTKTLLRMASIYTKQKARNTNKGAKNNPSLKINQRQPQVGLFHFALMPSLCHLMWTQQPVNFNIMKTHTDAFVGRPHVPAAESKNKRRRGAIGLFARCKGACCIPGRGGRGSRANNRPAGSHETHSEVTTRGQRSGGTWEWEFVVVWRMKPGERKKTTVQRRASIRLQQTDGQPAVTTAPVCCKLKRIRGPTVTTMTSLLHHMSPCNKRKWCSLLTPLAVRYTVALKCLFAIIRLWISSTSFGERRHQMSLNHSRYYPQCHVSH